MNNNRNDPAKMNHDELVELVREIQSVIFDVGGARGSSDEATEDDLDAFDRIVSLLKNAHLGNDPDISF